MRKKKIDEAELPSDNLAVYQLVIKESGGIIKDFALRLDVPPQTIQRLFKIDKRTERYPNVTNEVAADAGIDKPLSSHWGRRTVAVMFANHHVPYEIVAKILGHGNVSTTAEFYARILDSSVIEAMKKAGLDGPAL